MSSLLSQDEVESIIEYARRQNVSEFSWEDLAVKFFPPAFDEVPSEENDDEESLDGVAYHSSV